MPAHQESKQVLSHHWRIQCGAKVPRSKLLKMLKRWNSEHEPSYAPIDNDPKPESMHTLCCEMIPSATHTASLICMTESGTPILCPLSPSPEHYSLIQGWRMCAALYWMEGTLKPSLQMLRDVERGCKIHWIIRTICTEYRCNSKEKTSQSQVNGVTGIVLLLKINLKY